MLSDQWEKFNPTYGKAGGESWWSVPSKFFWQLSQYYCYYVWIAILPIAVLYTIKSLLLYCVGCNITYCCVLYTIKSLLLYCVGCKAGSFQDQNYTGVEPSSTIFFGITQLLFWRHFLLQHFSCIRQRIYFSITIRFTYIELEVNKNVYRKSAAEENDVKIATV